MSTHMTKSMPPSVATHFSTALCNDSIFTGSQPRKAGYDTTQSMGGQAHFAHVAPPNAQHLGALSHSRNLARSRFSLFNIPADYAGVCAEPDKRSSLHAADTTSTARDENDSTT